MAQLEDSDSSPDLENETIIDLLIDFEEEETTKFGTTQKIQNALESLLTQTIIPNQNYSIDYSWSGIMGVGANKSPIIKMLNKNTAIGVRLGGMGVALGSQVGKKLSSYF